MITKPEKNEYLPLVEKYIDLAPEGNILEILRTQKEENMLLLNKLTEYELTIAMLRINGL